MPFVVRPVRQTDRAEWLRLRRLLWPDCPEGDHAAEMEGYLLGHAGAVFVAEREGGLAGFVEASVRQVAESCGPGPVGYVEGWFVDADLRRRGVGRHLVRAAEEWARGRGCREMASDAEIDNAVSRAAHAALGYQEVSRLAHFQKSLGEASAVASPGRTLRLILLPGRYAVCRLPADAAVPAWATGEVVSISRTSDELSVVCRQEAVPEGVRREGGWRCLGVAGPLDFAQVGVLAALLVPLAEAGVAVFALSTFDTDYLLVKDTDRERALAALRRAGHEVGSEC
jgi:GNAT superfamily N-acetyltransferase